MHDLVTYVNTEGNSILSCNSKLLYVLHLKGVLKILYYCYIVAVQWDFGLFVVLFIFQLIHLELPCAFATHVYVDLVCSPGLLFYIKLQNI